MSNTVRILADLGKAAVEVINTGAIAPGVRRSANQAREWMHSASAADVETMRMIVREWDQMTRGGDTKRHQRFGLSSEANLERFLERVQATEGDE